MVHLSQGFFFNMRKPYSLSFLLILLATFAAAAESSFDRVGIPILKSAVLHSFPPVQTSPDCPEGGSQSRDNIAQTEESVINAKFAVTATIEKTRPVLKEYVNETGKCGACKQINQVSMYTTSEPAKVSAEAACGNKSAENIRMTMPDKDIDSFIEAIVSGKTTEGRRIYAGCPDPCSLYTASSTLPAANNKVLLNLTVHCGQPRKGTLLFSKYKFTTGIIHKWTCQNQ